MAIIIYIIYICALPFTCHTEYPIPHSSPSVTHYIYVWLTYPPVYDSFFLFPPFSPPKLIVLFFFLFHLESNAENCSISISPVLSLTSLNISSTSASVNFSPIEVNTCFNSAAEINPSPFLSKTLNASSNSC